MAEHRKGERVAGGGVVERELRKIGKVALMEDKGFEFFLLNFFPQVILDFSKKHHLYLSIVHG